MKQLFYLLFHISKLLYKFKLIKILKTLFIPKFYTNSLIFISFTLTFFVSLVLIVIYHFHFFDNSSNTPKPRLCSDFVVINFENW